MVTTLSVPSPLNRFMLWFRSLDLFHQRSNPDALQRLTEKFEAEFAQRRVIEQELAHLASFAEMDPNCIIETDMDGRVVYRNIVAQEEFPDLVTQGAAHPLLEGLEAVIWIFKNQERYLLSRPVKFGERVFTQQITLIEGGSRLRIYMTDITELKRLDQLKTEFVNVVSHELRSPLTSMQAAVRLLHDGLLGPLTNDQKKALSLAVLNIDRLGRLVNNLLDISRIEAGKFEIYRQPVDLGDVAQELQHSFEPLARERGLDLRLRIPASPLMIYIDRDKILQVITNLIQNAMKFTPKGWVEIAVAEREGEALCSVADSGPGIAPEDLPKLFGKFQQIGLPSVSHEKGTGLGLSICKGIVELHRGKIWVESTMGQGTRFSFTLPRISPEDTFREKVLPLFESAVAGSKPMCLFAFQLQDWEALQKRLGIAAAADLMTRLEALVRAASRRDSDPLVKSPGTIWLATPGVDKSEGRQLAARVAESVRDFAFQSAAQTPVTMDYNVAAYPEDGHLADQLLGQVHCNAIPDILK